MEGQGADLLRRRGDAWISDGSHKKTRDEEPTAVYLYDGDGRVKVKNEY